MLELFGERVKSRRIALNMTQEELARKLGYSSRSTVNKIELGKINVTQTKVIELSRALDCSISYLMGWQENTPAAEDGRGERVKQFAELFSKLSDDNQDLVLSLLESLAKKQ